MTDDPEEDVESDQDESSDEEGEGSEEAAVEDDERWGEAEEDAGEVSDNGAIGKKKRPSKALAMQMQQAVSLLLYGLLSMMLMFLIPSAYIC